VIKTAKVKRICKYCGGLFFVPLSEVKRKGAIFCSRKCKGLWRSEHFKDSPKWKPKAKRICKQCGAEFEIYFYRIKNGDGIFCSRKCKDKWQSERRKEDHPNWKGGEIERICVVCGKRFRVKPCIIKKGHGKYCSCLCSRKARKIPNHHTKPEKIFQEICQKNSIPFQYVGDSQLWIGKKGKKQLNPDFIEANGKKICIEIMGAWWHSCLLNKNLREDALLPYRKKHYKKYKWVPIFIWDTDLLRKDAEQFVLNELRKNGVLYER